jgi:ribosomal protein S18 acetylase RimI-like enzyme
MAATPLDNPVWYALTGPHARFAMGQEKARHYPRDMAPFSAIEEPTLAAYADLAADLLDQTEARLFRLKKEPTPAGWEVISAKAIFQMTLDVSALPERLDAGIEIVPLGPADVAEMLALVEATRPGPFGPRTIELGTYVGVRDLGTGRLIAMGGERFQLDRHVELSAIAVHAEARGQGLGAAITAYLARAVVARGRVPFLHVFPDNRATGLYTRLGFRERARLWVLWCRPVRPRRPTTRTIIAQRGQRP